MTRLRRVWALPLLALGLSGCGVVDKVLNTSIADLIGLGDDVTCDISERASRVLSGAYLRQIEGTATFEPFFVQGQPGMTGLPRFLTFDDLTLRRLSEGEDGVLRGARASEATPIAALDGASANATAYELSYTADDITYTGPIVVGPHPAAEEIPNAGQVAFAGKALMTLRRFADDGSSEEQSLQGTVSFSFGFSSKRGGLRISDITVPGGGSAPFAALTWSNLGLCGARVTSTGQGVAALRDAADTPLGLFGGTADPFTTTSILSSAFFANATRPGPPGSIGGVFVVQGDGGSLTGIFVADGSS